MPGFPFIGQRRRPELGRRRWALDSAGRHASSSRFLSREGKEDRLGSKFFLAPTDELGLLTKGPAGQRDKRDLHVFPIEGDFNYLGKIENVLQKSWNFAWIKIITRQTHFDNFLSNLEHLNSHLSLNQIQMG